MPGAEAAAPVTYAWWVLALGALLLVAALAWLVWALYRPRSGEERVVPATGSRRAWVARVEELHEQFRRGELDLRGLHLALAGVMRAFGSEHTGRDVRAMTRGEVAEVLPRSGLGELLARYEQPSFSRDPRTEAEDSVRLTLEVISRWR